MKYRNVPFSIEGYKGGSSARTPVEANEGIYYGTGLALSTTKVEVLDLISEGMIQGLVTGEYFLSGVVGNIGWSRATFKANSPVQGVTPEIRWLQSTYWNDVPVASKNGQLNFQQINVQQTKGTPNGSNVSDQIIDEVKVSRNIQERLRGGDELAKTYRIINRYCKSIEVNIRIDQLFKTEPSTGDTNVTNLVWRILYKPIFANESTDAYIHGATVNVKGKLTSSFIKSSRVDMPDNSNNVNFIGWDIKIVRDTEDSTTSTVRDITTVDSITEVYGDKLTYPNSAIIASNFDAEYFQGVPTRLYLTDGIKVNIPNNYDPILKTYNETSPWDGTFKTDKYWTDNPAWCFYDLLTNRRYGLGNFIDESTIDKFTLYEIAKYCDTLVPDGYGGIEPRLTCNLYISSRDEAGQVINEMASVFRAITYYSAGSLYTSQDCEKDPIYQFTNANVENGDFTYSSSSKKARHTVALVRYNDKNNLYRPAIEYVEDIDGIRQYGIREIEITALGCTSRGQAMRMGRWGLLTERLETESVSFVAGMEAAYLRPGNVIQIYDQFRNGVRYGGRISEITCSPTATDITLDDEISLAANASYKLSILTPSYVYDSSIVNGLNSLDATGINRQRIQTLDFTIANSSVYNNKTKLSIPSPLNVVDYNVSGNNIWTIDSANANPYYPESGKLDYYRVLNINETDKNKYQIEALQYDITKFRMIDSGFSFEASSSATYTQPSAPTNLQLVEERITNNTTSIKYSFSTPQTDNVSSWRVFVKNSDFSVDDETTSTYILDTLPLDRHNGIYVPPEDGTYYFRVYGLSNNNILSSAYASNSLKVSNINSIADALISSLRLKDDSITELSGYNPAATNLTGYFYNDSPVFTWQAGVNGNPSLSLDLQYRITFRSPSANNIPSKEIYYQETGYRTSLSNLSYTFDFAKNFNAVSTNGNRGPLRKFDIVVEAMNSGGYSSAGGNFSTSATKDALYNNPFGYDIFNAENPQPGVRCLTDPDNANVCDSSIYQTQQWLTNDGDVKILFTENNQIIPLEDWFGDDLAGSVLYYSNYPFNHEDILRQKTTISTLKISNNNNPSVANIGAIGKSLQYIAIAPYDSFDQAYETYYPNYLVTGLNISNTVTVKNITDKGSYRAWGSFAYYITRSDYPEGIKSKETLYNFSSITFSNVKNCSSTYIGDLNFTFEKPLSSNNYIIIKDGNVLNTEATPPPIYPGSCSTYVDGAIFNKTMYGFSMQFIRTTSPFGAAQVNKDVFIGVLSNSV